jgi:hypothetical protein
MVRSAPRYDPRILRLLGALDDRDASMAEICRRVGAAVESLGLTRPSYVHLRRHIVERRRLEDEERERREALQEIASDVATDLVRGVRVDAYEVAERVRGARRGS